MAKKSKDTVTVVDGVKITMCAYRGPRKGERTYDPAKSRYSAWHQGVSNMNRGKSGIHGTMD